MTLGELLSLLTLLVTVIGWTYTARKQSDLARQVRKYQLSDREVQAFRSRLPLVSEMTSALTDASHILARVAALAKFGFEIAQSVELDRELRKLITRVVQVQNNPEFIRLRTQLPGEANQEIERSLTELVRAQKEFSSRFGDLHPENPAEHARLIAAMPDEALKVSGAYIVAAATIARVFAPEDSKLSGEGRARGRSSSSPK